jgi:hypothetical protein
MSLRRTRVTRAQFNLYLATELKVRIHSPPAESHTNHRFLARDRGMSVPRRERSESVSGTGTGQGSLSRVAQNALDLCNSDPINPSHLGDRHTVLHPRPDAGKLLAWDLARRRGGGDCCFRLIRQDDIYGPLSANSFRSAGFDCRAFAAMGLVEHCDPNHHNPDWEFAEDAAAGRWPVLVDCTAPRPEVSAGAVRASCETSISRGTPRALPANRPCPT